MNHLEVTEKPILIQPTELSPEALRGVIENFILREGTDYGLVEVDHETKIEQIQRQIDSGDLQIFFDLSSETVTLRSRYGVQK